MIYYTSLIDVTTQGMCKLMSKIKKKIILLVNSFLIKNNIIFKNKYIKSS